MPILGLQNNEFVYVLHSAAIFTIYRLTAHQDEFAFDLIHGLFHS